MPAAPLTALESKVCDSLANRAVDLLNDLERSVNIPTGHNHKPGLDEIRGLVTRRCEALGATTRLIPGDPRPDWLWGAEGDASNIPPAAVCVSSAATEDRARGARGSPGASTTPRVLICSHLDTVFSPPPHGAFTRFTLSSDRKTGVGPGVVDMKGGVVIALAALEALAEAGELDAIAWAYCFNSDEETGSYFSEGALRACAREADIGLCTEPALPNGGLVTERLGSGQFQVECLGRGAHVGRDFESGVSAVTALAKAIIHASEIADAKAGRIVSIGPIRGSEATNIVPDHALAWGNARFPSQEVADEIGRRLDALMTQPEAMPKVIVRRSFNRPAKPCTPGVRRLADLAAHCSTALGRDLPFGATGGVCDGNILQDEGLPCIDTLGVRGGGLHTPKEWIEIPSLVERAQLFALFLMRLPEALDSGR